MSIQLILEGLVNREGGYVDHPDDKGGPTNYGITLRLFQKYYPGGTIADLKRLTKTQAYIIYEREFYKDTNIAALEPLSTLIAEEVLDTAVNMGPVHAIKMLQRALNAFNSKGTTYPDIVYTSKVSDATVSALRAYLGHRGTKGEIVLLKALNCLQGARYIELSEAREANESFVYGWINNRIHV